jgi:hypothetical protein
LIKRINDQKQLEREKMGFDKAYQRPKPVRTQEKGFETVMQTILCDRFHEKSMRSGT